MAVVLVLLAMAGVVFLMYRLAVWQTDREYAQYRRATGACFDAALDLIHQGDYAGAQRLVALQTTKR